ncbi:Dihydroorotase [Salisediminibacterium beveridgei]|uniref:Dihydroorotase n=2 Tax=Salisediminibacterium beveridgei TaxID=632773 RepID=A0A1D7QW66_9BACI|nr:dihydroorotase [Salisediminibacterium beveridgei]AOM83255.1 Dihydroorotase [Salisediminibacterium beveridgei]
MWYNHATVYSNGTWMKDVHVLVNEEDGTIDTITSVKPDESGIDVKGKWLIPGLVDLHVHLREPGGEAKETILTGTQAAAKGGFTTICAMPNTRPVPDTVETWTRINQMMKKDGFITALPYASITIRQLGEELVNVRGLKQAGAVAITDDGVGVKSAGMMYRAMQEAAKEDIPVVAHCEDISLVNGGAVHEGTFSQAHGIKGITSVSESVHIARDCLLAEATGAHYHVCHVSTKESVRVIRDAKRAGIRVTAEVTPHHLVLTDEDIPGDNSLYKMNPPLRSKADREALIEGLIDGTLDIIATDHAPHTKEEKEQPMIRAPFGITGFETAFPLLYTHLVQAGFISISQLIDWLTVKPAEVFQLQAGELYPGGYADFTIIDPEMIQEVDPASFLSKGKNTPFGGTHLTGWPVHTVHNGKVVYTRTGMGAEV